MGYGCRFCPRVVRFGRLYQRRPCRGGKRVFCCVCVTRRGFCASRYREARSILSAFSVSNTGISVSTLWCFMSPGSLRNRGTVFHAGRKNLTRVCRVVHDVWHGNEGLCAICWKNISDTGHEYGGIQAERALTMPCSRPKPRSPVSAYASRITVCCHVWGRCLS